MLLAVSLLPGVLASESTSASGMFVSTGLLHLPPNSTLQLDPRALFLEDTSALGMELRAPSAHVYVFEDTLIEGRVEGLGAGRETSFNVRSYPLTDLVLTLREGQAEGWLGYYPAPDAHLESTAPEGLTVHAAKAGTILGNSALDDHEQYDLYNYGRPLDGLILATFLGATNLTGGGALKVEGGELALDAKENRTRLTTGQTSRPVGPTEHLRERTERWVVIEADDIVLILTSTQPLHVAFEAAQTRWDGNATLDADRGQLAAAGATYTATAGLVNLDGHFQSRLRAEAVDETPSLVILLEGTLRASSLTTAQSLAPQPQATPLPTLGGTFLLVGLALVGGAAGIVLLRRPRREARALAPHVMTLDACLREAQKAADLASWMEAAEWIAQGRNHDPTSAALWMREARFLAKAGEVERALQAFRVAGTLSSDGEAELEAALFLGKHGGSPSEVEELFDAHLRKRSPTSGKA